MKFVPTGLGSATLIEPERHEDARGWFVRTYCEREFAAAGLPSSMVQSNLSLTRAKGTLRGMHWQRAPHAEDKLVRCVNGAIWDVIVDVRPESADFRGWWGVELSADNGRALLVPKGFAHGFVALADDAVVADQVSELHAPGLEAGARYDDPAFDIRWPVQVLQLSDKDRAWPAFGRAPTHEGATA